MSESSIESLAVQFIEAVKAEDEATVVRVLTSPLAAQVAVRVADYAAKARASAAEADHKLRVSRDFREAYMAAARANRALVAERGDLRRRLEFYRKGLVS